MLGVVRPRRSADSSRSGSPARRFRFRPASVSRVIRRLGADGGCLYLLRQRTASQRHESRQSYREGAILRLRADHDDRAGGGVGLLPAALATGVATDTQRPFALVIVSGLFTRLLISIFLIARSTPSWPVRTTAWKCDVVRSRNVWLGQLDRHLHFWEQYFLTANRAKKRLRRIPEPSKSSAKWKRRGLDKFVGIGKNGF